MKTIIIACALAAICSPALADSCWIDKSGDRLIFSDDDATLASLATRGVTEDCGLGRDPSIWVMACGSPPATPLHWHDAPSGPHISLVWNDVRFVPCLSR